MSSGGEDYSYVRRRLARIETIVASLFISQDIAQEPGLYEEFLLFLRRSYESEYLEDEPYPEREFYYMLERLLSPMRRRPDAGVQERLSLVEQQTGRAQASYERYRSHFEESTSELRTQFETSSEEIKAHVDSLRSEHNELQQAAHSYFAMQSMGLDISDVPLTRFVPIRVYLSEDDATKVSDVSDAVERLTEAFGFSISDEFPAKKGSWWKKWFARTKEIATEPEIKERLARLERALEIQGLLTPQAQIDRNEAEAVAKLAEAVKGVQNAAVQAGSVLFIKTDDCIQVRTLTQRELVHLERNQDLLTAPSELPERLAQMANQPETPT
ncbi:MAG: hypothetical protein AAGG48_18240 [Planctomycetota bacterium]